MDPLLVKLASAVIVALCGAVGVLFKIVIDTKRETKKELLECQEDRKSLWKELANLKTTIETPA